MKKININIYVILAMLLVLGFESCKKDPVIGGTATQKLAGSWWIKLDGGTGNEFGDSYYNLVTYNTSSNKPDSMWFDDGGFGNDYPASFWEIKGTVACNAANQTFGSKNIANVYYASTFTITDGKVLTNAAHAPGSGDKTDSITFKISFSDDQDPTVVHTASGYKRTGFSQDDH